MMKRDGRKLSHEVLEELRFRAIELWRARYTVKDIVAFCGFHHSVVYRWIKAYQQAGQRALKRRPVPGAEPRLDAGAQRRLLSILDRGALRAGFDSNLWTCKRIAHVIRARLGIQMTTEGVRLMLRRLGLTPQVPQKRYYEQDEKAVRTWTEKTFPAICRQAKRSGAVIYFEDESNVNIQVPRGRTWAQRGGKPTMKVTGRRASYGVISSISQHGRMVYGIESGRFNADKFIGFLKDLLRHQRRKLFLILDGAPCHKANKVKDYVGSTKGRLKLFFLPPYSPELNCDERVWNYLKHVKLKGRAFKNGDQLKTAIHDNMEGIKRDRSLVASFFEDIFA